MQDASSNFSLAAVGVWPDEPDYKGLLLALSVKISLLSLEIVFSTVLVPISLIFLPH